MLGASEVIQERPPVPPLHVPPLVSHAHSRMTKALEGRAFVSRMAASPRGTVLHSVGDDRAAAFADLLTVSETANEPPQDEGNSFNSPRNLAMEATYINHNFSQQCLRMVRTGSVRAFVLFCQLQLSLSICFVAGSGLMGLSRTEGAPACRQ